MADNNFRVSMYNSEEEPKEISTVQPAFGIMSMPALSAAIRGMQKVIEIQQRRINHLEDNINRLKWNAK